MDPQVYFVVGTDKSQADTVSRLMTQLIGQLKEDSSSRLKAPNDRSVCHEAESCSKNRPFEIIVAPQSKNVKTAITAETIIDCSGRAEAKVQVSTKQDVEECKKPSCVEFISPLALCRKDCEDECLPKVPYCELVQENNCKRRNGLDPTFAEIKGFNRFEYVPLKSKIPDYNDKGKTFFAAALTDHLSATSNTTKLCSKARKRSPPIISGLRQDCAKNLPENRLIKYKECINRRDGLQDKCDPLTRNVLKKCCKTSR